MDFFGDHPVLFFMLLIIGGYVIWLITGGPERAEPKWNSDSVSIEGVDFDRILDN